MLAYREVFSVTVLVAEPCVSTSHNSFKTSHHSVWNSSVYLHMLQLFGHQLVRGLLSTDSRHFQVIPVKTDYRHTSSWTEIFSAAQIIW